MGATLVATPVAARPKALIHNFAVVTVAIADATQVAGRSEWSSFVHNIRARTAQQRHCQICGVARRYATPAPGGRSRFAFASRLPYRA
jgi:hypothetical protein